MNGDSSVDGMAAASRWQWEFGSRIQREWVREIRSEQKLVGADGVLSSLRKKNVRFCTAEMGFAPTRVVPRKFFPFVPL